MTEHHSFVHSSHFPCTPQQLYDWHSREGALERLIPPWEKTRVLSKQGGITPGATAELQIRFGPIPLTWNARHVEDVPGEMFRDIQEKGPFAHWSHSHRFHPSPQGSRLEDRIDFSLPAGSLQPGFAVDMVHSMLRRIFTYRHATLKGDIELHARCSTKPMRILVTGGSGVLGNALRPLLTTGGHTVWSLVRRTPDPRKNEIFWDPEKEELNPADLPELDGLIHLAGDNIGEGRWSADKKKRVIDSRVQGTGLIARTVAGLAKKPKVFLSASAVGFYGDCRDCCMSEEDSPGLDFISDVCSLWERAGAPAKEAGIRTVFMRIGVVLSPRGGALQKLLTTAPVGFCKSFGSGDQFISWITIDDMISAILHALTCDTLAGPVNIAAPEPVTNAQLMQCLAKVMRRPLFPPIPASVLKTLYGQMASEVLLSGCRVSTEKLRQSGFTFRHPEIEEGLRALLGKY